MVHDIQILKLIFKKSVLVTVAFLKRTEDATIPGPHLPTDNLRIKTNHIN